MKKSLIALAVLAAAAGSASAQSSVTVFGVVDLAVRHLDNSDDTKTLLSHGGLATSRLGFRGVEDLGGGLKAGFWIESEVKPDAGTADTTRFWGRRATLSLMSDSLGEIRLGRDFVPTYTTMSAYDAFGDNGIGALFAGNSLRKAGSDAYDTQKRADNQVAYFLPSTLGGIYGQVSAAAGEGTVGKKYYGGRLGYKAGPLDVSAAYSQTELTNSDNKLQITVIGGSYDLGVAKLMAAYQQAKYDSTVVAIKDGLKDKLYTVGVTAPVGNFVIRAAYARTDADDDKNADHYSVGAIYNLSKRTAFYGTYSLMDNEDNGAFSVNSTDLAAVTGKKSQGLEIGIRHSF